MSPPQIDIFTAREEEERGGLLCECFATANRGIDRVMLACAAVLVSQHPGNSDNEGYPREPHRPPHLPALCFPSYGPLDNHESHDNCVEGVSTLLSSSFYVVPILKISHPHNLSLSLLLFIFISKSFISFATANVHIRPKSDAVQSSLMADMDRGVWPHGVLPFYFIYSPTP